ncbi:MAG: PAS domain S-box protein [Opitutae bacterium]|nr:PAS domain S-box protein [Opitutae bacterium]
MSTAARLPSAPEAEFPAAPAAGARWLPRLAGWAGLASAFVGLSSLLAWGARRPMFATGLSAEINMKTNTALGLLLAGAALWLTARFPGRRWARRSAGTAAAGVALLGLATLAELTLGWSLGIDELLFRELPGAVAPFGPNRMVPATAVCLLLVGSALALAGRPATVAVAKYPALLTLGFAFPAVLGHFYGGPAFVGLGAYFHMAAATGGAFQLLGAGLLFLRPARSPGGGGPPRGAHEDKLMGRLLLLIFGLFPLLGWLGLAGLEHGLYRPEFGAALMVTVAGVTVSGLVLWNARAAAALGHARQLATRRQTELAAIVASSNDAIIGQDLAGRITSWNRGAERLFGYTKLEMLGQPVAKLTPPDQAEVGASPADRLHRGESVQNYETRRVARDGRTFEASIMLSPIKNDAGETVGVSKIVRDITAQKHAAQVQRELSDRLTHLLRASPTILYTLRCQAERMEPVTISENIERLLGYPVAEALQPGWWADHLAPDDRPATDARTAAVKAGAESAHDYRFTRKDGTVMWVHDEVRGVRDAAGRLTEVVGAWTDITERKRAEITVRENEERLRLALNAANQGLYDLNVQTGEAQVSPEYAAMLGYDPATFHASLSTWLGQMHPADRKVAAAAYLECAAGRSDHYRAEYRQRARDGSWIWLLSLGKIVAFTPTGQPQRILGTHTDITGRKTAEAKIRQLSRLYEALSHCNQAIVRCRSEAELFAEICRAAVEFGGMQMAWIGALDETRGRVEPVASYGDGADYLHEINITTDPADPHSHGPVGTAVRERRPVWFQDSRREPAMAPWRDRGERFGWQAIASLPLSRNGAVIGAFSLYAREANAFDAQTQALLGEMAADLSYALANFAHEAQRKDALAALHLQSAALAATVDSVMITNLRGEIEWVNPAFTKTTGYASAEVSGRNPSVLKSGEQPEAYYAAMWQTISAGRSWSGEFVNRRKDGTLFTEEVTIAPVRDQTGAIAHYVAVKQDITEKKSLEKQLFQTQRLEGIGLLASGIAHDLNNVLAPISLSIELLRVQYPGDDQKLEMIEQSCRRGAGIIRQVLTFARGADGERSPLQVGRLVKELVHLTSETFPRNIEIAGQVPHLDDTVSGDPTQLHQVLLNLCVNARDAMPAGGRLTLGVGRATLDDDDARTVPGAKPGDFVVLSVRDTGTGIPPEILEHIFEPFFTTKPRGQGTGLGLSTVHGIVRSHGGFIEVRSQPGLGTEFRVHLPALPPDEHPGPTLAAGTPFATGRGETILLADDEISIREITGLVLARQGYTPLLAKNGAEALALFHSRRESIRLVILDRMMPGANGEDVAREIHAAAPALPIFLSTGLITEGALLGKEDELKRSGIRGVLHKPYHEAALLKSVSEALSP